MISRISIEDRIDATIDWSQVLAIVNIGYHVVIIFLNREKIEFSNPSATHAKEAHDMLNKVWNENISNCDVGISPYCDECGETIDECMC